jgi:hypothetical protein
LIMDIQGIAQLLGNFGEFFGALAVFATLLYLATQVREAGRSAKLAAVQANRAERIAWFRALRDSPHMIPILQKAAANETLSREEQSRLLNHVSASWALQYSEWVQREIGSAGEFATSDEHMRWIVADRFHMAWWNQFAESVYPAGFVEYVEALEPAETLDALWGDAYRQAPQHASEQN